MIIIEVRIAVIFKEERGMTGGSYLRVFWSAGDVWRVGHDWATELNWTEYIMVCVNACVYQIFFIHLSVSGHLGWFHVLAIVKIAEMNMGVQTSL